MGFTLVGICVPSFVLGPILALIFSLGLGWLPPCGWGSAIHFVLPACTLGLITAAPLARLTRGSLMEVRSLDYVRTARSKGISERAVVINHALRNAWLPVVTMIGLEFGFLLGGVVVIETVFTLPGVGASFIEGAMTRDYTRVMGAVILYGGLIIALNLIADVLYAILDPRVRYS
jgi:ABC-type dipeptide/oligopeptide/nickel transport system permease component